MPTILNCPSCGAPTSPHGTSRFVECDHCGTSVAVSEFYKLSDLDKPEILEKLGLTNDDQLRFSRMVRLIDRFIDDEDYTKAEEEIVNVLRIVPDHEPSYFNLALCRFNLLEDDLERAEAAQKLLNRTASNTDLLPPELESIREALTYNIAILGTKFGNNPRLFFDISKSLILEYEKRDDLIRGFLKDQLANIEEITLNDIRLRKKEYMPNKATCELLLLCSDYFEEATELLCTCLSIPVTRFEKQSPRNKQLLKDTYNRVCSRLPLKTSTYTFGGFFGGMKQKELLTEEIFSPIKL